MKDEEEVEGDVKMVCVPKRLEEVAAGKGQGERVHGDDNKNKHEARHACQRHKAKDQRTEM